MSGIVGNCTHKVENIAARQRFAASDANFRNAQIAPMRMMRSVSSK